MHFLLLTVGLLGATPDAKSTGGIDVDLWGMNNDKGVVRCGLYDHEEGFPAKHTEAVAILNLKPASGTAHGHFEAPKNGTYAIACFHDENENGKVDANFMGIPWEGTGSSKDAPATMGPPKFKDASFAFSGAPLTFKVHINR